MKIIAVDDEQIALDNLKLKLERLEDDSLQVRYFTDAQAALDQLSQEPAELAILDINMRGITGLELAEKIGELCPSCLVSFLTGYEEFVLDAFKLHVFDYLMKPVRMDDLRKTIADAKERTSQMYSGREAGGEDKGRIFIQTFGGFDVFEDGKIISIPFRKSKELLAYLVDRRGSSVPTRDGCLLFWPDSLIDRTRQSQYQTIVRNLVSSLEKAGVERILVRNRGSIAVDTSTFDCDMYRYLEGDEEAEASFRGEYMPAYSWGEETLSELWMRRGF